MGTTILIGLASGLLFAILDMLINANPLARRLNALFLPIARQRSNRSLVSPSTWSLTS